MNGRSASINPAKHQSAHYRPDIDGLRAVAVLSVVAYHLGIGGIPGGYVGVDVFFIISGFLITSIVFREISNDRFSLVKFYERRIRRIMPALTVVLVATTAIAWFHLLPEEFKDYSKSLLAAVTSVSNILFWLQAGYFDAPSEMKPLLHTWSLGVEEQFYLFFPPLLMLISRFAKEHLRRWIVILASLSFLISAVGVTHYPTRTFYLIDSRAWELMIGSMLALDIFPAIRTALMRNLASAAGLLMILGADIRFTSSTPFPGPAALLPCVGAALIIAAGKTGDSLAGKLLSIKPLTFIGLISYSLYLWHWPILIFHKLGILPWAIFRGHINSSLMVDMIVVAILSWRFVEVPFREGPLAPARKPLFLMAGAVSVAMAAFALAVLWSQGAPGRYTPEAVHIASYLSYGGDPVAEREGVCMIDRSRPFSHFNQGLCLKEATDKPNFLLLGDSHAAHLWRGLSQQFPELNIMQATAATCKPFIHDPEPTEPFCSDLRNFVFKQYLPTHHVDGILLSGAWIPASLRPLSETLAALKSTGAKVYLVGPNAGYQLPLPRLLVASIMQHDPSIPARDLGAGPEDLDKAMASLAAANGAAYISLFQAACPGGRCTEYAKPTVPLLCDGNHFTAEGSVWIAQKIRETKQLP